MSRFASRIFTERMYLFTLMPKVLRMAFCSADCEIPAAAARSTVQEPLSSHRSGHFRGEVDACDVWIAINRSYYNGWVKIDKELSAAAALKMKPSEREKANACRIDYIYVSPKVVDVLAYTTMSDTRKGSGAYYSDHFPSVSRIRLR